METCETATSQSVITKHGHVLGWELYLSGTTVVCKTCFLVVFDQLLDWIVEQVTEEDGLRSAAPRNFLPPQRAFMVHFIVILQ